MLIIYCIQWNSIGYITYYTGEQSNKYMEVKRNTSEALAVIFFFLKLKPKIIPVFKNTRPVQKNQWESKGHFVKKLALSHNLYAK